MGYKSIDDIMEDYPDFLQTHTVKKFAKQIELRDEHIMNLQLDLHGLIQKMSWVQFEEFKKTRKSS